MYVFFFLNFSQPFCPDYRFNHSRFGPKLDPWSSKELVSCAGFRIPHLRMGLRNDWG